MKTTRTGRLRRSVTHCLTSLSRRAGVRRPTLDTTPAPSGRPTRHPLELGLVLARYADDVTPLWYAYLARGGDAGWLEFDAYVHGALAMPAFDALVLDHTAWELEHFPG